MRVRGTSGQTGLRTAVVAVLVASLLRVPAAAREPGDPIRLTWTEGDLSGFTNIYGPEGTNPIGVVEYTQRRRGETLETRRVAYFLDGSSDEDSAEARVGRTLSTVRGRSIIRDTAGRTIVDMLVDVPQGRVHGFYGLGKDRKDFDERGAIPAGTYFGPLINIALKNFDANAEGGKLVFHTVVPTPSPRQMDMEVVREKAVTLRRPGRDLPAVRHVMRPTIHPIVNPVVRMIAPDTYLDLAGKAPPGLARFAGPRNFAGQEIRIE
jgi:hypothetical protein